MENLPNGYADDSHAYQLITELSAMETHSNDDADAYVDGLLRYKNMIWVGNNGNPQNHIMQAMHISGVGILALDLLMSM
jgi:ornithine carbamoyltransferase